jgi:hypothetical protein
LGRALSRFLPRNRSNSKNFLVEIPVCRYWNETAIHPVSRRVVDSPDPGPWPTELRKGLTEDGAKRHADELSRTIKAFQDELR